jgi:hypothetical protein
MKTQTFLSIFAAISCVGLSGARAADEVTSAARAEAEASLNQPAPIFEIESGVMLTTRDRDFQYTQGTAAVGGSLNESGFRARLSYGWGRYNYPILGQDADVLCVPGNPVCDNVTPYWLYEVGKFYGNEQYADILVGYQYVAERWELLGLIGVGNVNQRVTPRDPDNMAQGNRWGVRIGGELWATPTNETMLDVKASYLAAFETAEFDVRPGYLILDRPSTSFFNLSPGRIYFGPMVAYESDLHDRFWRFGGQVTFAEFGPFHTTIGVGYAHDKWNGPGLYGLIETAFRF